MVKDVESKLLSVKEIIKRSRSFNLNSNKYLKTFDLRIISQSTAMYHLINNPAHLIKDYKGDEYNFLGVDETELREYHKIQGGNAEKKIIVESRRQSNVFFKTYSSFFFPDYYEDKLSLLNETLDGPLGPDCFDNYSFKLINIDSSSGKKIYCIRVKEKNTYIPSFNGTILIEDSTFALKQVSFKTNLAVNIPLVKQIHLINRFDIYLDSNTKQVYSIPVYFEFKAIASFAGVVKLKFDSYSVTRNININHKQKGIEYDEFEIVIKPDALNKSNEYWDKIRFSITDTLSESELEKINKIKNKPTSFVKFTGTGLKFGENLTWNLLYLYTFNRIEGNHLELFTSYEKNFKRFLFDSRFIYGTANRKFGYSFNLKFLPSKKLDFIINAQVFSDVAPLFKKLNQFNYIENAISTLFTRKDRVNYYNRTGFGLIADYRISKYFTIGADFFQEKQSTASNNTNFSFVKKNENYSINPRINDGTIRKFALSLIVDFNKYRMIDWGDGDVSRIRQTMLPVMEFRYGYSDSKILKSSYDFKEYNIKMTGSALLASILKIIYKAGATLKYGDVPYQELSAIDPKFLGFPNNVSMITPNYSEFLGDRMVFFNLENEFGKIFPIDIPILNSITLLGNLCFGKTWISDDNRRLSGFNNFKTTDGIFTEIGFGLTRILEICTLRYSWRLNNFMKGSNSFLFFDVGIRY